MTERVIRGETVSPSASKPISSKPEADIDPIDGMVIELVHAAARRYRARFKFWGALALIGLAVASTLHDQWAWVLLWVNCGLSVFNLAGLIAVTSDFYHDQTRREVIARGRYLQSGGR